MGFMDRWKNAWNAFLGRSPTYNNFGHGSYGHKPDRFRLKGLNARSIVSTIYNKIAVDVSLLNISHVRLNDDGQFEETIKDSLNDCLTCQANIDQTSRELIRDAVISMFDEGCVAIVPTLTDKDPFLTDSYKIYKLRTGKIVEWFPTQVRVRVYCEDDGMEHELIYDKKDVAIIENPFYYIMNEPNSTAQRLLRLLKQVDQTNEDTVSGKLDMIIQLPYIIKSEARKKQAEERRRSIEEQLTNTKYGIAYTDGSEKVMQLNRSLENNLWQQAKDLQTQLYNELGLAESIFNGTADEKTLLNYNNSTIEPIILAIVEAMDHKWITPTARSQGQAIKYFKDPFRSVPVNQIAEIADKFTRNEIMSSNELRSTIGLKPSKDPKADELRNANLNHPDEQQMNNEEEYEDEDEEF